MREKVMNWLYLVALSLSLFFVISAIQSQLRLHQSIHDNRQALEKTKQDSQAQESQLKTYQSIATNDIPNSDETKQVGETFLNEMFAIIPSPNKSKASSSVASEDVVNAFLQANFGAGNIQGTQRFDLFKNTISYTKNPDGTGYGLGTLVYQFSSQTKPQHLTVFMTIKDGRVTEIQTGQLQDEKGGVKDVTA
ncbi:hypothetical protein [Leuconostoc pseudomesenteroides]|uniref:hypothetical protein n=1 Tax=Leuconostoc pseudomesenteroides TaxID=33968 RepID=UPI0032DF993E